LSGWAGAVVVVSHDRFLVRRVVQGERERVEGEDEEEDEDEEDEDEGLRRRLVYLLKGGVMKGLPDGVAGFEESLEKRVQKLLAS
jgi:ATPase subunit of ABC transporter with duplicated ATPase domains